MVQALWIRLRGLDIDRSISYEKNFGSFGEKLERMSFRSFSRCSCERWIRVGGDLVGKEVLALILGKRDWESSSSFNQELLKNFIVSQILGPEEEMKSYYTHCIVAVPSYPICSIWILDYSTYTLYNIHTCTEYILTFIGCILYTKDCGRTCTWYKDE